MNLNLMHPFMTVLNAYKTTSVQEHTLHRGQWPSAFPSTLRTQAHNDGKRSGVSGGSLRMRCFPGFDIAVTGWSSAPSMVIVVLLPISRDPRITSLSFGHLSRNTKTASLSSSYLFFVYLRVKMLLTRTECEASRGDDDNNSGIQAKEPIDVQTKWRN